MLAFETELHRVESLAFSPCGRYVAAGGIGVELWQVGGDCLWRRVSEPVAGVLFDRAGDFVFARTNYRLTRLGTRDGVYVPFPDYDPLYDHLGTRYRALAVSPADGRVLAAGWPSLACWDEQAAAGSHLDPTWRVWLQGGGQIDHLAVLPDGRIISCESGSRTDGPVFAIRSPTDGSVLREVPTRIHRIRVLGASPDGRHLAAARDDTVRVWAVDHLHRPPRVLTNATKKAITALAFHPAGRHLATASNDCRVTLWDAEAWQPAHVFRWQAGRARSVAFAPDGLVAAVGTDTGAVVLFDVDV